MKYFLATLGVVAVLLGINVVSIYNTAVDREQVIVASYDNMKNILGQYSTKIGEMAQVPAMYKDDLKELYKTAIEGRYGAGGSKALFQFLKEQNPNLDPKLYQNIQEAIEAGRNEFQNSQTKFIDTKRVYESSLRYAWTGAVLKVLNMPTIDLAKYKIIESEHGQETFSTGVDKGLKLR